MARGRIRSQLVLTHDGDAAGRVPTPLIVEEPMEIRLDGDPVATTTRTPGHDHDLAVGRCLTEGLLDGATVQTVRYCGAGAPVDTGFNVVSVETVGRRGRAGAGAAAAPLAPACGWIGDDLIDDLALRHPPLPDHVPVAVEVVAAVVETVAARRELFERTGRGEAAAVFTADGEVLVVREDVVAENAADAALGRALLDGHVPAAGAALHVTAPADFHIVRRAWAAGCTTVVAGGPPTGLAVDAAVRAGIALFVCDGTGPVQEHASPEVAGPGR